MNVVMERQPVKGKRKSYLLRIDAEVWDGLNEWAGQEFRSVNGQIELILKRSIDEHLHKNKGKDRR